jgi:cob(I)alamin adenosyltransferase
LTTTGGKDGEKTWPRFEVSHPSEGPWEKGCVHVYTGGGKGKSTAAFGLILRAAGHGLRCCLIQFLKKGNYGEIASLQKLPGVTVEQYGSGHWVRKAKPDPEDIALARTAWESAREKVSSGNWDIVVLDEINIATKRKLLTTEDVLTLIDSRKPRTELVLTGRGAPRAVLDRADYVTMMVGMKHPFHQGTRARKGIEW